MAPERLLRLRTGGDSDPSWPPREVRRFCFSGRRTYSSKRELAARLRFPCDMPHLVIRRSQLTSKHLFWHNGEDTASDDFG